MPGTSERSIAQHISNVKLVIDHCSTFGAQYNPSNLLLTIPSLTGSWDNATSLHETYNSLFMASKHPINARKALYKRAVKIVTRSLNYFQSTGASYLIIQDVKGIADRFRGHGTAIPRLEDGTKDPNHVSNSHVGFSQRADAFRQLCALYASDSNYALNEEDLQLDVLNALADALQAANENMSATLATVMAARIARDEALYDENTGLYALMRAVKLYVRSVFGTSSPEYRSIAAITFKLGSRKLLRH